MPLSLTRPRRRNLGKWLAPILFVLGTAPIGFAQAPDFWKNVPDKPEKRHIVVDANTGQRLSGQTLYKQGQEVTVYFANINPFRFEYEFDVQSKLLATSRASSFLGLLGAQFQSLLALRPDGTRTPQIPDTAGTRRFTEPCSVKVRTATADIRDKITAPRDKNVEISDEIKAFGERYETFLSLTEGKSLDEKDFGQVYEKAKGLREQLASRKSAFDSWDDKLKTLVSVLKALDVDKSLDEATNSITTCDDEIASKRETLTELHASVDEAISKSVEAVKLLRGRDDGFKVLHGIIVDVLAATTSPFFAIRYAEPLSGPTGVTIRIHRKDYRVEGSESRVVPGPTLQIGDSNLITISGGLGLTSLDQTVISTQIGKVVLKSRTKTNMNGSPMDSVDANGNKVIETRSVLGRSSESSARPLAIILLNAHLGSRTDLSFGGSIGVAVPLTLDDDQKKDLDYLIGGSIGFLSNQFILSVLAHAGRTEELSEDSGFALGDPLPSDTNTLPVTRSFDVGWAIALTYRIK